MKKLIPGLIFIFILFSSFTDDQIWIKAKMPNNINPGDRFTIEIIINKLNLQHFAELKQKLPQGFRAVEKSSGSAQFSFKDQMVKFTWVRLPRAPQFSVVYEVVAEPGLQPKTYEFPAQFTYIYKNQRGTAVLQYDEISVGGKVNNLNPNNQATAGLFYPPKDPNTIQCIRVKPVYSKDIKGYAVKLLVSRGNVQSMAKIQEKIPAGFNAQLIDGKSATFSFENSRVEFIWKKMPADRNFEVSYKLFPVKSNQELSSITGNFDYLLGGSLKSYTIKEVDQNQLNKPANQDLDKKEVMNFFN